MDIPAYNREAWDRKVAAGTRWAEPVTGQEVARARAGDWHIILTPNKPVPELAAGFVITGFYEDGFPPEFEDALTRHMPTIMACRATRPAGS